MDFYESQRYRISISADDFGVSPRANRNILYLISIRKINRVGVMAYGKFSKKELDEIIRSGVKLDIHLDVLNKFHDDREKRQGTFLRGIEFIGKLITGNLSLKKVENEWRGQIEKFKEIFEKNPDGINSHEHVHFFPPFFNIALKLKNEYSIPYIRFGDSVFMLHNRPAAYLIHWLRLFDRKAFTKAGCVSSGSFTNLDWIKNINKFLDNLPEGTIEIACHPEIAEDFVRIRKYF